MPARTPQPPALVQFRSEAGLTLLIESIAQQYGCDMDAEDRSELNDLASRRPEKRAELAKLWTELERRFARQATGDRGP